MHAHCTAVTTTTSTIITHHQDGVSWNHREFRVSYPSLHREHILSVGTPGSKEYPPKVYYLRQLVSDRGTPHRTALTSPRSFFMSLYHSTLRGQCRIANRNYARAQSMLMTTQGMAQQQQQQQTQQQQQQPGTIADAGGISPASPRNSRSARTRDQGMGMGMGMGTNMRMGAEDSTSERVLLCLRCMVQVYREHGKEKIGFFEDTPHVLDMLRACTERRCAATRMYTHTHVDTERQRETERE
jgi:hypothetical protein